jgi:hypothetical protein
MYKLVFTPRQFEKSFSDFTKKDAEEYLQWFLSIREERMVIFQEYIKLNFNENFELDYTRDSLSELSTYLNQIVQLRKITEEEFAKEKSKITGKLAGIIEPATYRLTKESVSFCFDLGMYFGATIIRNTLGLYWTYILTPKKYIDFGQPVITNTAKKMALNPRAIMEINSRKVIDNPNLKDSLISLFDIWNKMLR